jgi:hypothetical protein
VHTMSGGEIYTVNVFDGQSSGRRRSQGEIELRSFSEKSLGSKGGDLNLSFARDSPEFILAPTYQ